MGIGMGTVEKTRCHPASLRAEKPAFQTPNELKITNLKSKLKVKTNANGTFFEKVRNQLGR